MDAIPTLGSPTEVSDEEEAPRRPGTAGEEQTQDHHQASQLWPEIPVISVYDIYIYIYIYSYSYIHIYIYTFIYL